MIQAKTQKRSTESLNKQGLLTQSTFVWNSVRQLQRLESLPLNHRYLCSEIIHTKDKEFGERTRISDERQHLREDGRTRRSGFD